MTALAAQITEILVVLERHDQRLARLEGRRTALAIEAEEDAATLQQVSDKIERLTKMLLAHLTREEGGPWDTSSPSLGRCATAMARPGSSGTRRSIGGQRSGRPTLH